MHTPYTEFRFFLNLQIMSIISQILMVNADSPISFMYKNRLFSDWWQQTQSNNPNILYRGFECNFPYELISSPYKIINNYGIPRS